MAEEVEQLEAIIRKEKCNLTIAQRRLLMKNLVVTEHDGVM
ncbi:hypothetical protein BVRB_9g211590 [Beta vulgaris subsp. vulgaris]|nr:hypothetical protein BVRB_9g211590 [Beta vulgaris subsp. vulgaris]